MAGLERVDARAEVFGAGSLSDTSDPQTVG
jgi:hypothetical protein